MAALFSHRHQDLLAVPGDLGLLGIVQHAHAVFGFECKDMITRGKSFETCQLAGFNTSRCDDFMFMHGIDDPLQRLHCAIFRVLHNGIALFVGKAAAMRIHHRRQKLDQPALLR